MDQSTNSDTPDQDVERGEQYKDCIIDPFIIQRETDTLEGTFHQGSGISEPEGELVSVSRMGGDKPNVNTLCIPVEELDDYVALLSEMQDEIEANNAN